ncbi:MAG: IclR family transcriptional regulator [Alicyclobacillaceae bacterium]|nr:IclR family transcriptional regulator [Alicyclobacillaceae bacterium]
MTSPQTSAHATVRAVDRALDILLCFARAEGGLTLSEIAREVQLHKSTVHRLLVSLQQKGFVRKQPDSDKYWIGWSVLELLSNMYRSDQLAAAVLPEMTRLRDLTGETVSLYVRSGIERIRIQSVESHEPVRNVAGIGKTYPLYVGASGKVLLAFSGEELLQQVLDDPSTPRLDVPELRRQLAAIREQGYAISIQERDAGAAALAVPILIRSADVVAALSVSGPATRFTPEKMMQFVDTVKQSADVITKLLSH